MTMADTAADPLEAAIFGDEIERLSRDVRAAGRLLTREQARFLVGTYYDLQGHRVAMGNQAAALQREEKPNDVVEHLHRQMGVLERQCASVLAAWADQFPTNTWAQSQKGIGPILSAGLLAHIDITQAPTVGHIWSFAGLNPNQRWEKGQKRPYNADLKVLCWKIGDSFVKVSGKEDAYYGRLYRQRKEYEVGRDERGELADQAHQTLEKRNIKDPATKRIYESGHMPAGRLDLRARRWTVKLFLSHWHDVAFREHFGEAPPNPYPIAHLGHVHYMEPPT
jgi:hypothetical protein